MSLGSCSVCGKDARTVYPLLAGSPAFCGGHHNSRDAGHFGCDFSGPDNFDIPMEEGVFSTLYLTHLWTKPKKSYNRKKFVWTDQGGNKHKLKDIDDVYLRNIIGFLKRSPHVFSFRGLIGFLEAEQTHRKDVW